jgi:DTW domain-containing protein YfiP
VVSAQRCPACLLLRALCICGEITPVRTRTRVVILRHRDERLRASNTGRIAAMALGNAELIDQERTRGTAVAPVPLAGTWLLWPEGPPARAAPKPRPKRLVLLDATWPHARRMRRRLSWLHGLPVLSLPVAEMPRARLRASPGPGRVSTIEAIARALRLLEGEGAATELERLFTILVARARIAGRQVPSPGAPSRRRS